MSTVTISQENKTTLPEEFERLYREHATFVYRTALRITRNAEEAEDILQTIFLRLLRRESSPDLQKRPRAYLYRAAVNAALDAIESRRNRSEAADVSEIEATLHSPDSSAKERLHQQLHKAIAELNPACGRNPDPSLHAQLQRRGDREDARQIARRRGGDSLSSPCPAEETHQAIPRRRVMKRQQAEAVLNRFFEECGDAVPAQGDIEPVLDRVWERLEWKADEFVDARVPAAPARPFRFAWAAGIVLVAVLVNALVWRQGPPFSVAVRTADDRHSLSKLSSQQAGETLQVTVPQDAFELASVKLLVAVLGCSQDREPDEEFAISDVGLRWRLCRCGLESIPVA